MLTPERHGQDAQQPTQRPVRQICQDFIQAGGNSRKPFLAAIGNQREAW